MTIKTHWIIEYLPNKDVFRGSWARQTFREYDMIEMAKIQFNEYKEKFPQDSWRLVRVEHIVEELA